MPRGPENFLRKIAGVPEDYQPRGPELQREVYRTADHLSRPAF
jgi:hypothetical protein